MPLAFTDGRAGIGLPLPGRLSFAARQGVCENAELLFDTTLTFWSGFRGTVITPTDPMTGVGAVIDQNYHNALRFALGAAYTLSPDWTLRGGGAYDQSPVPQASEQAAPPDRDRFYAALGASYLVSSSVSLDIGFSHALRLPVSVDGLSAYSLRLGHDGLHVGFVGYR